MTSPLPPHYVTFSAFHRPSSDIFPLTTPTCQSTQSRAYLHHQHECLHGTVIRKILHVFRPLCPLACAAWLHIPDISFFAIRMGPSSLTFSTRFVVSAHSRVCVCIFLNPRVVTPSGHFDLHCCSTFLLKHLYSLQHPLLLMLSLSLLWSFFSLYQTITPYIRFCNW
jgi:hypothetical protein